jgi:hypothetical protein
VATPNPANRPPTPPPLSSAPKPMQQPPAGPPPKGPPGSGVPKSFNVDAAVSSTDDSTERWLIQKDKLDFGPFNLADVRSQVEGGKILGDHTIIDTETGERRKVKDHPQLREMVMQAETRMAEHHRQQMEDQEKRSHRGKITSLLAVAVFAVIGIGVGIFFYSKKATDAEAKRKTQETELLAAQVKSEQQLAQFLSGVEINMKVDPPAAKPAGPKKSRSRKGGSNNQYSDVTNLGDASDGGGEESLDQSVVQGVMKSNFKVLVGCILEERRRNPSMHNVDMDFIIKGTGNVSGVKVNGSTESAFAHCMLGKMQTVSFPKFNGAKTHASFSLSMK